MRPEYPRHRCNAACDFLESRRLLSAVFLSRPQDFPSGFGPNSSVGSVGVGDINSDTKPDLVLATDGGSSIDFLLGNGDAEPIFAAPSTVYDAGADPQSPTIADMDGDNINDIVVANSSQAQVSVLFNDGDNHFTNRKTFAVGSGPGAVAVADFKNDQKNDIVVANAADGTVSLLLNTGNQTFATQKTFAVGNDPVDIVAMDVNRDNKMDLVVANANDNTVSVLLGNNHGSFLPQMVFDTGYLPTSIAVTDFNGDNKLDIVATNNGADSISLLLGNGKGSFLDPTFFDVAPQPSSLVVGDFNNDTKPDIATLSELTSQVSILLGNGDGTFQAQTNFAANPNAQFNMASGNFLGGNFPGVVTANEFNNSVSLMFSKALTPALTLDSPADGAKNLSPVTLSWNGSDEFPTRVIVSTNRKALPTDPSSRESVAGAIVDTVTGPLSESITINPKLLKGNTTYFWEVQPERGSFGLFSKIRSFTTANNVPKINPIPSVVIQAGKTFSASGSFNDTDPGDTWTAAINYGDGSKTTPFALHAHKISLSHLYATAGDFKVVVQITDSHGASGVEKFFVHVVKPVKAADFAKWTSHTTGTLDAFSYAFSSFKPSDLALETDDLSTSDFGAAPGSSSQKTLDYAVSDAWSITFNNSVPQLLLDALFWRGTASEAPAPTINYTFNQPFLILSGFSGAKVNGNTLSLPNDSGFFDGIIEFANVKTLSVTTNADIANDSRQALTFALAK
jgi:hypothetical protein